MSLKLVDDVEWMLRVDEEERWEDVGGGIICTCVALASDCTLACFDLGVSEIRLKGSVRKLQIYRPIKALYELLMLTSGMVEEHREREHHNLIWRVLRSDSLKTLVNSTNDHNNSIYLCLWLYYYSVPLLANVFCSLNFACRPPSVESKVATPFP